VPADARIIEKSAPPPRTRSGPLDRDLARTFHAVSSRDEHMRRRYMGLSTEDELDRWVPQHRRSRSSPLLSGTVLPRPLNPDAPRENGFLPPSLPPVLASLVFQGIPYFGPSMNVSIIPVDYCGPLSLRSVFWMPGFYGRPTEPFDTEPSNISCFRIFLTERAKIILTDRL